MQESKNRLSFIRRAELLGLAALSLAAVHLQPRRAYAQEPVQTVYFAFIAKAPEVLQNYQAQAIRTINTSEWPNKSPGLAGLHIVDKQLIGTESTSDLEGRPDTYIADLEGNQLGVADVPDSTELTGITFDDAGNYITSSDPEHNDGGNKDTDSSFRTAQCGPDGVPGTADDGVAVIAKTSEYKIGGKSIGDAEGIEFWIDSSGKRHFLVADGADGGVYKIDPGPDGILNGVKSGDDSVEAFYSVADTTSNPEALAVDANNFYVAGGKGNEKIGGYDVQTGAKLQEIGTPLGLAKIEALAVGPSSDGAGTSFYAAGELKNDTVVASGIDVTEAQDDARKLQAAKGGIVEFRKQ